MSNTQKIKNTRDPRPSVEMARAEAKIGEGTFSADLETKYGNATITVLNPMDWEYSAIGCLRSGDLAAWAERAMDEQNFAAFDALHPSMREVRDFAEKWEQGTGQDLGKSEASD